MLAELDWSRVLQPEVLSILLGCSIVIIAILGYYLCSALKTKSENDLKQSMVERGMSAEEIERVLSARSSKHG